VDLKVSVNAGAGGEDPCIVLGELEQVLHVYKLHEDGQHIEESRCNIPQDLTADCRKTVTADGDILLQENYSSTTLLVNQHSELDRWQQEGALIACLSAKRAVYQRWTEGVRRLVVREESGSVLPVEQTWRGALLSVCGDQDKIAVIAYAEQTLSILSTQGNF